MRTTYAAAPARHGGRRLVLAALPAQAQTKWDLPAGYPAGNPHTQNLTQFATDVADGDRAAS